MAVIIYYRAGDKVAEARAAYLLEGGYEFTLKKGWHGRFDRGTQPNQKDHTHLYFQGEKVCVVNRDGTPSHNTNLNKAPGWAFKELRKKGFLNEATLLQVLSVPADIVKAAVERVEREHCVGSAIPAHEAGEGQRKRGEEEATTASSYV